MPSCLIIEDDCIASEMAAEILKAHGFSVRDASNAEEGLRDFLDEPTDIVVLDLNLPGMSGFELLAKLPPQAKSACIITTADTTLDCALRVLREGAGDFLPKPYSEEMLLMSAQRILSRIKLEREKQELTQRLQRRFAHLSIQSQISQLITSRKPTEIWMDEVIRITCSYIGAQAGSLLLLDPAKDELVFYISIGPMREQIREQRLPHGKGIAWWCLEHQESVKVDHVTEDGRFDSSVDSRTGFETRNLLAVPILVKEECIGVIELLNCGHADHFTEEDLELLRELTNHIAVALQNAISIRDLQHSRETLVEWSQKLECIVTERTQALQEANQARRIVCQDLDRSHRLMKRAQGALVEREKMAALGMLAAGVAHEVNNPLGFISSNLAVLDQYFRSFGRLAEVLLKPQAQPSGKQNLSRKARLEEMDRVMTEERIGDILEDLRPLLQETSNGVARISRIVEQLRNFVEDGGPADSWCLVDLNLEVSRLVALIQGACGGDCQIHLQDLPPVELPIKILRQVLLNLFCFLIQDGKLHRIRITGSSCESQPIVLSISDWQHQLEDQEIAGLFEPLGGLGDNEHFPRKLGLGSAQELAKTMGATLEVVQTPEGGTCLNLSLPRVQPKHHPVAAAR